ncbi:hypothetical protein shim_05890 [Shimia sp. SK013]|uniref:adenylosuccinate lyase n=1 Tax=Shimia sp. SK013 TaxID=1389006 RepID=UPI0006CE0B6A|nr:adenylosuccinate lyase [Shimia sp. SK013]KPA22311.1 hypothetical protein shim_05890 [Shimia sp. SK013]
MTVRSLIIAAALAATPGLAAAMGCGQDHAVASCADGTSWDTGQQRCVSSTS